MGILWRKKDSSIVYKNPDAVLGPSYTLTGLEPNTTYEIKVHVSSEGNSIPISDWMLATTHAKRMYKLNQNKNFFVLFCYCCSWMRHFLYLLVVLIFGLKIMFHSFPHSRYGH